MNESFSSLTILLIIALFQFKRFLIKSRAKCHASLFLMKCFKSADLALVTLKIVSPSLDLVGTDESTIYVVFALEDCGAMVLNIKLVFLLELKVFLSIVIKVTRLPNQHCGHLIRYEALSAIE